MDCTLDFPKCYECASDPNTTLWIHIKANFRPLVLALCHQFHLKLYSPVKRYLPFAHFLLNF